MVLYHGEKGYVHGTVAMIRKMGFLRNYFLKHDLKDEDYSHRFVTVNDKLDCQCGDVVCATCTSKLHVEQKREGDT